MRRMASRSWATFGLLGLLLVAATSNFLKSPFEQLDLLVDVRHQIVDEYVEQPDEAKMILDAVRAMVESLDDPHTVYLTPEELEPFDREVRGSFSGIGAEVEMDQQHRRVRVVSPLEDSPAWAAGVMAGDLILEVNGDSTADMTLSQAVDRLTGPAGTKVVLKVRRVSGEEQTITLTRAQINVPSSKGLRRADKDHRWQFMLDPQNRIGYVRILQFSDATARDLQAALEQLKQAGVRGLILDLRFDPGGLLESAVDVSNLFLPAGKTIVSVRGRTSRPQTFYSTTGEMLPDVPIVVLANEASASAAEIVTGALADNGRAKFGGARTFGKGSVQQVKMLPTGEGAIKVTNAYYYLPSGRNIHRRPDVDLWGVDPEPGFYVPMTPQQVKEMIESRRKEDVLRSQTQPATQPAADATVTPQWLREQLKDPQLAAGLEAVLGRLTSGQWPRVGETDVQQQVELSQRQRLRAMLEQRVKDLEKELLRIDQGVPLKEIRAALEGRSSPTDKDDLLPDDATQPSDLEPTTQPSAPLPQTQAGGPGEPGGPDHDTPANTDAGPADAAAAGAGAVSP